MFAVMRISYKELQTNLTMDRLIEVVRQGLMRVEDPRKKILEYSFHDLIMSAYALFLLKYPSLLRFEQQGDTQRTNLMTLFGIEKVCSDAQLRKVLDLINPHPVRALLKSLHTECHRLGVLREYQVFKDYLICSIDGVHHYSSQDISCENCLEKQHRDGTKTYSHSMLCGAIVHPERREVFPIAMEPILKQDGSQKNDCERNAAKRMIEWMSGKYKDQKWLVVEDALYANGPHIEQIVEKGWSYIIGIKPGSHKTLFDLFESRKASKAVKMLTQIDPHTGSQHIFEWSLDMPLNQQQSQIRCHMLKYTEIKKNGERKEFSWITDIKINKSQVFKIMRIGRSRWKIENETFNTLKNQGYNFEHNYGHGNKNLATVMAYMMVIAFTTDQLFQACSLLFDKLCEKLKSRTYVWELVRAVFMFRPVNTYHEMHRVVASEFFVQLE